MNRAPLVAFYAALILAISVAAWAADGCLVRQVAWQTSGGCNTGWPTQPAGCYANTSCNGTLLVRGPGNAWNSTCNSGYCGPNWYYGWCTGGNAPWTQTVFESTYSPLACWVMVAPGDCGVLGGYQSNYICTSTTRPGSPDCYTTWYNDPGDSCDY